jgi:hypothetical protein
MTIGDHTHAVAEPTKHLFLALLTRDISLEHAVLDLIDNSVNSAIRLRDMNLIERFDEFVSGNLKSEFSPSEISITFSAKKFEILDDCGGIPLKSAKETVFRFGRLDDSSDGDVLSVYGIGLKRALFKIGDHIRVWSQDKVNAFIVEDHAKDWAARQETEWRFPLTEIARDNNRADGTTIVLQDILPTIEGLLSNPSFEDDLIKRISETYSFFLGTICNISVNGKGVPARRPTLGNWPGATPQIDRLSGHGCEIRIIAGLAPRDQWTFEPAGWYVFCNGRSVLLAEKSPLTGWGNAMPLYMSKFRGFRGLVFFFSKDPEKLPWTTTKTNINQESPAYELALTSMAATARPVLNFLSSLYQQDEVEQSSSRAATEQLVEESLTELLTVKEASFSPKKTRGPKKVRVQYDITLEELGKVRRHRGKSTEPARKIGRMTFEYYLKNEGLL